MNDLETAVLDLRQTVSDMHSRLLASDLAVRALLRCSPDAVAMLQQFRDSPSWRTEAFGMTPAELTGLRETLGGLLPPSAR
jgi:hypothetical protein